MTAPARLAVESITKTFGAAQALRGVSLAVGAGEVVALVGENGAGKSTLIKILAGIFPPDAGVVRLDGEAIALASPAQAIALGIAVVHQDLLLCDNLSVAANLFLGREPLAAHPLARPLGWIDRSGRDAMARAALARIGLDCDPRRPLASLGPAARQLVEIARALSIEARVVIMDEPTSSLDTRASARLLDRVRELRERGVAVLYVSHRLDEVTRVADRAVVLRDGALAGTLGRGEIDAQALVRLMLGPTVVGSAERPASQQPSGGQERAGRARGGETVLAVRDLELATGSPRLSFDLVAGEILGVFGLVGAGRTELLETLFGLRRMTAGSMSIAERRPASRGGSAGAGAMREYAPRSPVDAIAAGLAFVPEERKSQGLIAAMTVGENLNLADLARRPLLGWRVRAAEDSAAAALCRRLDVRPPQPRIEAFRLSGGNQQKVVLGKWLALEPRVLLLDEPTRGVDVGARAEIQRRLLDLARGGVAILLSTAETEEIEALADRVLVLRHGGLAGELDRSQVGEEALLRLAAGVASEAIDAGDVRDHGAAAGAPAPPESPPPPASSPPPSP